MYKVKKSNIVSIPFEGEIVVDSRAVYQSATRAMQGNIVQATIELISNCDDSYDRLEIEDRRIYITYHRKGFVGKFSVRDAAAGMDMADIKRFLGYWRESDLEDSENQRGYFNKGAKDALAVMDNGQIATFKNGGFILISVYFDENKRPKYRILKDIKATPTLRKKYGVKKNGTVASFVADPQSDKKIKVPRFKTFYADLSNHYLMRKILQNKKTIVTLIDKSRKNKKERLSYSTPNGVSIHSESFTLDYMNFDPFDISLNIFRSDTQLSQKEAGNMRHGGILIVDDKDVVLDISLFKYDSEPMASAFYGELVFTGFRKLMKANEMVLSPERDGILSAHPLISTLIKEVESKLTELIQIEKSRLQRYDVSDAGKEYQKRAQKVCDVMNEIAAEVLDFKEEPIKIDPDIKPINGFSFDTPSKSVGVDKNSPFVLRIDTSVIPSGTAIKLKITNPTIKIIGGNSIAVPIRKKGKSKIVTKIVTLIGSKPDESGNLVAQTKDHTAKGRIYISAPKDISEYGMAFEYDNCNVVPNKPKTVTLLVLAKAIQVGDEIILSSDNEEHIFFSPKKIVVEDMSSVKMGMVKFKVDVWGDGEGQEGIVYANCASYTTWVSEAMIGVNTRTKQPPKDRSKKLTFTPAELRSDLDPPQAASFSREMKKVYIYTKFPTVQAFVGEDRQFMNSLPGQICIAQLTIDKYCYHLACDEIEGKGTAINEVHRHDSIQSRANDFVKLYGQKLMKVSIDQALLRKSLREKKSKKGKK